jgi:biopolymer transport protein ExbB
MSQIYQFIVDGGIFMAPILLCSVISLALLLERGFALRRKNVFKASLERAIHEMRYGDSTTLIEQLSSDERTVLSRLVRSCLLFMPWSKAENMDVLQTKARKEVAHMERGLVVLEIIVGVGPLLGLLGTVSGLVVIFGHVGADVAGQGVQIAKGIAEALNTTVAGLVVAIPSLIGHSIFTRRVESFSIELESLCQDLLGKLYTEASV